MAILSFGGGHKNCCSMCAKVLAIAASVINIVFGIILLVLLYKSDYYDLDNDNFPDNSTRYGFRGDRKWLTVAAAYLILVGVVILSIEIPCVWALKCMPCFQNYICRGVTYVVGSVVGFIASYGWIGSAFFFFSGLLYIIAGCLGASGTLASGVI